MVVVLSYFLIDSRNTKKLLIGQIKQNEALHKQNAKLVENKLLIVEMLQQQATFGSDMPH